MEAVLAPMGEGQLVEQELEQQLGRWELPLEGMDSRLLGLRHWTCATASTEAGGLRP